MIEFAILLHLRRVFEEKFINEICIIPPDTTYPNMENDVTTSDGQLQPITDPIKPVPLVEDTTKQDRRTFLYNSLKIDYVALFVFGLLFCTFNVVYWVYYLLF